MKVKVTENIKNHLNIKDFFNEIAGKIINVENKNELLYIISDGKFKGYLISKKLCEPIINHIIINI